MHLWGQESHCWLVSEKVQRYMVAMATSVTHSVSASDQTRQNVLVTLSILLGKKNQPKNQRGSVSVYFCSYFTQQPKGETPLSPVRGKLLWTAETGHQQNAASQSKKGLTPQTSSLVSQKLTDHRQLLLPSSLHVSSLTYLTISRLIHLTGSVLGPYFRPFAFTRLVFPSRTRQG